MALKVTYIGHATTLIEWNGRAILTDPLFSKRVLFFRRKRELAFDPALLPKLDAILISHAHYDHLDLFSFKYIPSDVPVFIPQGMSKAIAPFIKNRVIELATWAHFSLSPDLQIFAVPARHPGGRLLVPWRYRLCHGYVIANNGENIYFAGDTAYGRHFADIRSSFPLKLALLPLAIPPGTKWRKYRHMDPAGFLKAWEDLGRPDCIPIHWGSFFRTWPEAAGLTKALTPQEKIHIVEPGKTIELPAGQPGQTSHQWPLRRVK